MLNVQKKVISQADFADFIGIEQNSLARMEKGIIAPKLSRLPRIAEGLDCTVADLFRVTSQSGDTTLNAKAEAIAEMLNELSPEFQTIVLELVEKTVSVYNKKS